MKAQPELFWVSKGVAHVTSLRNTNAVDDMVDYFSFHGHGLPTRLSKFQDVSSPFPLLFSIVLLFYYLEFEADGFHGDILFPWRQVSPLSTGPFC